MKKTGFTAIFLVLGFLAGPSFLHAAASPPSDEKAKAVLADMARFDKDYFPALALSGQGDAKALEPALAKLQAVWKRLDARDAALNPGDKDWKADFEKVGELIRAAEGKAKAGDLAGCHQALREAGDTLKALRARNGLVYYLDYVTDFNKPVEAIAVVVRGKRPAQLSDADMKQLGARLAVDAINQIHLIQGTLAEKTLYNFPPEQSSQMRLVLSSEEESLKDLQQAAQANDKTGVLKLGLSIQSAYHKLLDLATR